MSRWMMVGLACLAVLLLGPIDLAARMPDIASLQGGAFIAYADASGQVRIQPNFPYSASFTPNDPDFANQWNLTAIQMPSAWDLDQVSPVNGGDPNILVAVLDTGLAYEAYSGFQAAPDIPSAVVWTNVNDPVDGIDNDGNGLIDDIHGWDFWNNDAHPNDDHGTNGVGHGTHVAGTIAGATNNAIATAGIAFESKLLPIKVLDSAGNGNTQSLLAGIDYAITMGADIINLSLGGDSANQSDDTALKQKIDQAVARGILVIAATGNSGNAINFPASYPPVIAVGATDSSNQRASFSDFGAEIDLVAPGVGIRQQTCADGSCSSFQIISNSGTSQATAHVSGAAALVLACGAAAGSTEAILKSTALDVGTAGFDHEYGYGLIQVASALQTSGCAATTPTPVTNLIVHPSSSTTAVLVRNQAYQFTRPYFSWSGPAGAVYRVSWGRTNATGTSTIQTASSFQPTIDKEGTFAINVRIQDSLGQESSPISFVYRYRKPVVVIGQTSHKPGIRLYTTAPALIRGWDGGLGTAQTDVGGGALESDGTLRIFVSGRDKGRTVKVKDTRGKTLRTLQPFGANFSGSVDAAVLVASGQRQVVATTKTGGDSLVWLTPGGKLTRRLDLYRTYTKGLQVATGDLNGDGDQEIITAMTAGHEVRVYESTGQRIASISPLGKAFTGGWFVTTGDMEGDGKDEIVLINRTGGGRPQVFVTGMRGVVKKQWRLSSLPYGGAVELASADTDGDGQDEILAGYLQSDRLTVWSMSGTKLREHRLLTNGLGFRLSTLE